jgi:hypothetical protein
MPHALGAEWLSCGWLGKPKSRDRKGYWGVQ